MKNLTLARDVGQVKQRRPPIRLDPSIRRALLAGNARAAQAFLDDDTPDDKPFSFGSDVFSSWVREAALAAEPLDVAEGATERRLLLHSQSGASKSPEIPRYSPLIPVTPDNPVNPVNPDISAEEEDPEEDEYDRRAREVAQEMVARGIPTFELPMRLVRRQQSVTGPEWDEAIMEALADAAIACPEVAGLAQVEMFGWSDDPLVLLAEMKERAGRVKHAEDPLLRAVREADNEVIPAVIARGGPSLKRCYRILARLQRIVGDMAIHPGQMSLAKHLGRSQPAVSSLLRTLEHFGLLRCTSATYHSGGRSKEYAVVLPEHVDARGHEQVDG